MGECPSVWGVRGGGAGYGRSVSVLFVGETSLSKARELVCYVSFPLLCVP